MTNKIIRVTGCHDCDKKSISECRPKGCFYTIQYNICEIKGFNIEEHIKSKTIHPDCLLDDEAEETELQKFKKSYPWGTNEKYETKIRQDAVRHIRVVVDKYKDDISGILAHYPYDSVIHDIWNAALADIKHANGKSNKS